MRVTVMTKPPATPAMARGLGALARRAVRRAHAKSLEIALMGDRGIRALNRKFHHADRPTDVLAFDLGDTLNVAVSVDRARVQARALGHSLRREVGHLVVHGLLHLSGWRDDSPSQLARMNAQTERVLTAAGWIRS